MLIPSSKDLPEPNIPYITSLHNGKGANGNPFTTPSDPTPSSSPSASKRTSVQTTPPRNHASRSLNRDSITDPEMDPWASPAGDTPRAATRPVHNEQTPDAAGSGSTAARPVPGTAGSTLRTTSTFTTHGETVDADADDGSGGAGKPGAQGGMGGGWDSVGSGGGGSGGFSNGVPSGIDGPGFGSGGGGDGNPPRMGGPLGGSRGGSQGAQETITVTVLPEKEGMFMFQHRNYEVKSARRGSAVVRRYSDFVWLLDCLHKRYPFRQLPLLPPKTIACELSHR